MGKAQREIQTGDQMLPNTEYDIKLTVTCEFFSYFEGRKIKHIAIT